MATVYLICLLIGFFFALISAIGALDLHIGFEGDLPILSPSTIAAFITVFGGSGLFLIHYSTLSPSIILLLAIICALFLSLLVFFLVILPLQKSQKSSAHSEQEMVGHYAEVVTPIYPGKKGEIIYIQGGSRLSAPASSTETKMIPVGQIVQVTGVFSGTFIVQIAKEENQ